MSRCAGGEQQQWQSLREENDSLRWQLEAYRNEGELLRKEGAHRGHEPQQVQHNQQVQELQRSLHSTQQVGMVGHRGKQLTGNRSQLPAFLSVTAVAVKLTHFNQSLCLLLLL